MSEKKTCVRCQHAIDQWARVCPFCNWDQSAPPPSPDDEMPPEQVVDYKPPELQNLRRRIRIGAAIAGLLIASFLVGMLINRDGAPDSAPEPVGQQAVENNTPAPRHANTQLIPTNQPGGIGQPITSAPISVVNGTLPDEYQRSDATAVSSVEYAQLERRARAEKEKVAAVVDPRSLTGPAYAQGTPLPEPRPARRTESPTRVSTTTARERSAVVRTLPIPEYQPLPSIRARGTARLTLTVGTDGRVSGINIDRALPGNTPALLGSVKRWRFKPATEDGRPVAAPYTVEISFKDNG